MTILQCYFLGGIEIRWADQPISLPPTMKSQSLLAFLILHRHRPQPRDRLADLFWGERPERKARQSLSTALWHIRRVLPHTEMLTSTAHTVQIRSVADLWVDAEQFEHLMSTLPSGHTEARIKQLQDALDLYRGALLEGFYDDWLMNERYRLELLFLRALSQLMVIYEARGDVQATLKVALRLLHHAPLREDAHRAAMRAYYQLGQRNTALQQYQRCREIIHQELGIEPTEETTDLYRAILETRVPLPVPEGIPPPAPPPTILTSDLQPSTAARFPDASPFVGRQQEMATLKARWQQVEAGTGQCVFVHGEPGIGKTRLVEEFGHHVQQRGHRVIKVNCYEYEHALPYGPLADTVRGVIAYAGRDIVRSLSPWQRATLARLVPDLLPHGSALSTLPVDGDQTRLLTTLTALLTRVARQAPLLLIVEDLHWARPVVLAWLHYLARHVSQVPLLMLLTYRPNEPDSAASLIELTHQLQRQGHATTLRLERLTREDLAGWIEGTTTAFVAEMHRHTEGNPLFILETLRTLVDGAYLQQEGARWRETQPADELPIPDSVRQAIRLRLERLSPTTRAALDVAAVIGRSFDFDVLEQAWGMSTETTLESLDELLRHHLIREGRGPFARDYTFDHHLIRDLVLEHLPASRAQQLHRQVAQALEERHDDKMPVSAEIAYHYMQAQDWERAHVHLLRAGEEAGRAAADREALMYYRAAITAYERAFGTRWDPVHRARLERRIGEIFFRQGQHARAVNHLQEALQWLGHPLPTSSGAIRRGVAAALGRWFLSNLVHLLPRLPPSSSTPPTPQVQEEVYIYTLLGWIYALLADYEPYLLVTLRALNRSRRAGLVQGNAAAATALGFAADFIPLFRVAGHFHQQALNLLDRVDDAGTRGFVYQGMAYHVYLLGDLEHTTIYAQRAATAYLHVNDPHRWALAVLLMAYVEEYRGRFARAMAHAHDILRTGEETGDLWAQCVGEGMLGVLWRHRGEVDRARTHLQRAFDLAQQIPDYMSQIEIGAQLARTQLRLGAWSDAVTLVETQQKVAVEHGVKGDSLGRFLNGRALVYLVAAEQHQGPEREHWLAQAKDACRDALKGARAFRPGLAEAMRLQGRYEWLRGHPAAARDWWEQALGQATAAGHRLDQAHILMDIGHRLNDVPSLERGRTLLTDMGATEE